MNITVKIIERAGPALKRFELAVKNRAADAAIGRVVVRLVQDHFCGLPPNKRGFPSTSFWQRAAEATSFDLEPDGVRVSINQVGVQQRLLGGPISPVRGEFLTAPAIAETYGHSAADFSDLRFWRISSGGWSSFGLAPSNLTPDKDGLIDPKSVYFWLFRGVWQQPDPKVLPGNKEILETGLAAARDFFATLPAGGGNN